MQKLKEKVMFDEAVSTIVSYELKTIPVFKGAPFYKLEVTIGKKGVDWQQVTYFVGKCANRLLLDESINRFYYNQLDQYEKAIYDGIMNDLEYVESKNGAFINLGEKLNDVAQGKTDKELKDVVQNAYYALHYDQPGLFYLDRISLTSASTYKNGQIVTIYGAKTYLTADAKSDIAGIQTDKTRMETIKNNE